MRIQAKECHSPWSALEICHTVGLSENLNKMESKSCIYSRPVSRMPCPAETERLGFLLISRGNTFIMLESVKFYMSSFLPHMSPRRSPKAAPSGEPAELFEDVCLRNCHRGLVWVFALFGS